MTIEEISDLIDKKFDEKLTPVHNNLKEIKNRLDTIEGKLDDVLRYVPVGNEDLVFKLQKIAH